MYNLDLLNKYQYVFVLGNFINWIDGRIDLLSLIELEIWVTNDTDISSSGILYIYGAKYDGWILVDLIKKCQ